MFFSSLIPKVYSITSSSAIQFVAAEKTKLVASDWIFFTSKNAVIYFFELGYEVGNRKIACIGQGTKRVLSNFCEKIDFVGDEVNIQLVGKKFSSLIGEASCLFPISNISKRSIQKELLSAEQSNDLIVYQTQANVDFKISRHDILIFTSPSNVQSYMTSNSIDGDQKVIAIGQSTENQLKKSGVENSTVVRIPGEIGMIDALLSI